VDKNESAPVLEFWLTKEQWMRFTQVMDLCHSVAGHPVSPAECLELICRNYLERRGDTGARRKGTARFDSLPFRSR
jgi:hypothetical protein